MEMKRNPVGWFEIPVVDMERAISFYETIFGFTLNKQKVGETDMAWFPWDDKLSGSAGTLIKHEWYTPSNKEGVLIYFTSQSGDLANELAKVESAGGKIIKEKMSIGDHGYIGVFIDTEGNRIAIHSLK